MVNAYLVDTTDGVVVTNAFYTEEATEKVEKKGYKVTGVKRIPWADKYEYPSDVPSRLLFANGITPRCHKCGKVVSSKFKVKHSRAYCNRCIGDVK